MFSRIYLPTIEGGGCSAGFICLLLRGEGVFSRIYLPTIEGGGGVQPDLFAYYWGGGCSAGFICLLLGGGGCSAGFICLLLRGGGCSAGFICLLLRGEGCSAGFICLLFLNLFNTYFTSVVPTALLLQCNWPITGIRRVL